MPFINGGGGGSGSSGIALLADVTLGSSAVLDSGTFATSAKHLLVYVSARSAGTAGIDGAWLRFNADGNANYDGINYRSDSAASITTGQTSMKGMTVIGTGDAANTFGQFTLFVPNYADATTRKTCFALGQAFGVSNQNIGFGMGRWSAQSAITKIQVLAQTGSNMATGSRITVYGLG